MLNDLHPSPRPSPNGRGGIAFSRLTKWSDEFDGHTLKKRKSNGCCSLSLWERARVRGIMDGNGEMIP